LERVIGIFSVGQRAKSALGRHPVHSSEKLELAKITAVDWIAGVPWIVQFGCRNDLYAGAKTFGRRKGVGEGGAGQTRAVGNDPDSAVTQRRGRLSEKKSAVNSSGIGNQKWRNSFQERSKFGQLVPSYDLSRCSVLHLQLDPSK
jgi:hypothetical protein